MNSKSAYLAANNLTAPQASAVLGEYRHYIKDKQEQPLSKCLLLSKMLILELH